MTHRLVVEHFLASLSLVAFVHMEGPSEVARPGS